MHFLEGFTQKEYITRPYDNRNRETDKNKALWTSGKREWSEQWSYAESPQLSENLLETDFRLQEWRWILYRQHDSRTGVQAHCPAAKWKHVLWKR